LIDEGGQDRREQVDLDPLAEAGSLPLVEGGEDGFCAVSTSTTATPTLRGSPPASPVTDMRPPTPCTRKSYPGRAAPGPVVPKPDTEQYTTRGFTAATSS
jgi:hypothetical protein